MLKTRSRIINFRVTEEEFNRLRIASVENGARCLSEYARSALLCALEGCDGEALGVAKATTEFQALGRRLGIVELTIARLERAMSRISSDDYQPVSVGATA